jgi:hypothetical protein
MARLATHVLADSPSQRDFMVAEGIVAKRKRFAYWVRVRSAAWTGSGFVPMPIGAPRIRQ